MRNGRGSALAFVSVGSNIEPHSNVVAALKALMERVRVIASSTFYETAPIGSQAQPAFVNGVWTLRTDLAPIEIRDALLRPIEDALGRRRVADKFAPRTIDLDLILYDDLVLTDGAIRLPHGDIARPFVSVPIRELLKTGSLDVAPDLRDRISRLLDPYPAVDPPGKLLEGLTRHLQGMIDRTLS